MKRLNKKEQETQNIEFKETWRDEYIKGTALNKFLLQKQGKHWDAVPVPHIQCSDLSPSAFEFFRNKAIKSDRVSTEVLENSNDMLLDNLQLKEGDYIKRAAILMFHSDPEKFVTGAYVKIGFFKTDADLLYQDEIHGNLLEQADKTLAILLTKYLRAYISYEGISRKETYPFPIDALREALFNAIVHKDYSSGTPIQISVYEDRLYMWNAGQLPQNWTIKNLLTKHPSIPYNPLIANAFFRLGFIESWGRGFEKINKECKHAGNPLPIINYDLSGLLIEFKPTTKKPPIQMPIEMTEKTPVEMSVKQSTKTPILIMHVLHNNPRLTLTEVSKKIDKSPRTVERAVTQLVNDGYLEHFGPKKGGSWIIKKKISTYE
jgi:ATP-dependent DNA helicase RecG